MEQQAPAKETGRFQPVGKRGAKREGTKCTTRANDYPAPPYLCNCKSCARRVDEAFAEYRSRMQQLWARMLGHQLWRGFVAEHFTEHVLEFVSIYFKYTGYLSDDLIGEVEARFLGLAESADGQLHNIRYFTKTAKVIAAILAFRNCTRPKEQKSIRKLVGSNHLCGVKDMDKLDAEKAWKYGAPCWTAVIESFSKCVRFIGTVSNAPERDFSMRHDLTAAGSAIEELLYQLFTRVADRNVQIGLNL